MLKHVVYNLIKNRRFVLPSDGRRSRRSSEESLPTLHGPHGIQSLGTKCTHVDGCQGLKGPGTS